MQLVFVVDGLRPDLIDAGSMPTLDALRSEGVAYLDAHAEVPPVTRINGASMVTGNRPGRHGLVGNEMYLPAVMEGRPFSTADAAHLQRLEDITDGVLDCPSLASLLADEGSSLVTVGSGSSGISYLLNTEAAAGRGVMINTDRPREGVPLARPAEVEQAIVTTFGQPPEKVRGSVYTETLAYATSVVCEYVLTDLRPDVAIVWLTEPDHSNHVFGPSDERSLAARRAADEAIGTILRRLDALGIRDEADVMVLSDHGFSEVSGTVDLEAELIRAGLKQDRTSSDVVVAASGCANLHVRNRHPEHIHALARFLQRQPWAGAIFTASRSPGTDTGPEPTPGPDVLGWVDGTFSTALLGHVGNPREPDLVLSLPWSDGAPEGQIPGTSLALARRGNPDYRGQHGNLSPHDIRSTLICSGPSFAAGRVVSIPGGNRDVAPTVLALAGGDPTALDGRVLDECLLGSEPPHEAGERRVHRVEVAEYGYAASVEVAWWQQHAYLSSAWSERTAGTAHRQPSS